jgi:hypothetical protein
VKETITIDEIYFYPWEVSGKNNVIYPDIKQENITIKFFKPDIAVQISKKDFISLCEDILLAKQALETLSSCPKCFLTLQEGIALQQTYTSGLPDLGGEIVTMSPGGPGKLISCLKCPECGYSVTKDSYAKT